MLLRDIFILKDDANVCQKDAICQMDKISITSIFELAWNLAGTGGMGNPSGDGKHTWN